MTDYLEKAKTAEDDMIQWRRKIHENPELGFEEFETAKLVAKSLTDMGMEAEIGVGRTGVVARIGNGEGPKIGIRADMDALPIHEAVDLPFASKVEGKMHACGHDAHTAILLGVAKMLHDMPDLSGEVRFLFQPSEEKWDADGISGATAMISDEALEDLDHVIALHVDSTKPVGEVHIGSGYMLAAVDTFYATIFGEGTHGASPHLGIDPVYIQSQVIGAIQSVRSRRTDPTSASVITVGSIHGGSAPNVIPDKVELTGTIRSFNEEIRSQLHSELERALSVAKALGGDYSLEISRGYPSLYNDAGIVDLIKDVAKKNVGEAKTIDATPKMGAEDFSYMTQKAPGAMFFLGAKYDDKHRPHHSPIFAISEDAMKYGAAILAESTMRLLQK
ncbi:MAG: M20 family metallopeptidase [Chloroflexota bacterium]